jgi:hypothetical protein
LAKDLNRSSILSALKSRHFYATTGNRPLLDLAIDYGGVGSANMGDIVNSVSSDPILHFRGVGTAPIESVTVRNGSHDLKTFRSYQQKDLGSRIKIIWSGAEVRGRDRMVSWDGNLRVVGNLILEATPINFWNPDQPLEQLNPHQIAWKSTTTGGLAGLCLTLENGHSGWIEINTIQNQNRVDIKTVGYEPTLWKFGGVNKQIKIYRIPDQLYNGELNFSLPLNKLHSGDNPIYIRMVQENGHMAWSSPIYLVKTN